MSVKADPWNTHEWYSRRLEIQPGKPQMQRYCIRCGRNFVDDLWSGERYAAHAAIFHFDRLADEVTARWLLEDCPEVHLPADDQDRKQLKDPSSKRYGKGNRQSPLETPTIALPFGDLRRKSG
jgi:hypothetical protein